MALLQALFAFISKSAGKILNAIFGWAVRALFGQTTPREQTALSALVGAAAAWPVLLAGIAFPRVATLVLAAIPLPKASTTVMRLIWIGLAVLVPVAVGLAVASKAPVDALREPFWKKLLRGFPITLGLAAAFLVMFVSVPILKLASLLRGHRNVNIPLVTDAKAYHKVAGAIVQALDAYGFGLHEATPGWWVTAPVKILLKAGGNAFRRFVPDRLVFVKGRDVELTFYPSGIIMRGKPEKAAWAQAVIAEVAAHSDALETVDPQAQTIEKEIRRLWKVRDGSPHAHVDNATLLGRLDEIAKELAEVHLPYDEWQVLYRQTLQLGRALRGDGQLLEHAVLGERGMKTKEVAVSDLPWKRDEGEEARSGARVALGGEPVHSLSEVSVGHLIKEITEQVSLLAKKQIELARTELKADLHNEMSTVKGLGVAGVTALLFVNMLLVTAALALALVMPAWAAGLVVSGVLLLVAGGAALYGWKKRVTSPLKRTRATVKDEIKWTRERMA